MKPDNNALHEQRLDTWLWAARFFKTRSLAATAIAQGKVTLNGQEQRKSAKLLRPGDQLSVTRSHECWSIEIRALTKQRGSATVAQTLYTETAESKVARDEANEQRRLIRQSNPTPDKPDAHTRALLRTLRGKSA